MPVVDVQEEKPVKCSVELKGEKYASATECEFAFFDEKKEAIGERKKATVTGGKGECEWAAPKLGDGDLGLSKQATYKVFVGEEEYGGFEQDLLIWAKEVTVTALNPKDSDKPLANALVSFSQEGVEKPVVRKTDDKGIAKYPLQKPVAVKTEFVSPFELKSWTTDKALGRAREAKVERKPYKAAFYAPVWKTDKAVNNPHRQYVNLSGNVPNEGHTMIVKIGADSDKDKPQADRLGLEGDIIHIKVEWTKATKRSKPVRSIKVDGVTIALTNDAATGQAKLGVDGAPAEVEVELGYAGTDELTIKIGVTDQVDDAHLKVVTWRRILYELMVPKSMEADMDVVELLSGDEGADLKDTYRTKVANTLKPCGLDYLCYKSHVFADVEAKPYTMVEAAYVKENGRKRHVLSSKWAPLIPNGVAFADDKGTTNILLRLADVTLSSSVKKVPLQSPVLTGLTVDVPTVDGEVSMEQSTKTSNAQETIFVTGCTWWAKWTVNERANYELKLGAITGPEATGAPAGKGDGKALKVEALGVSATVYFAKPGKTSDVVTDLEPDEKSTLSTFIDDVIKAAVQQKKLEIPIKVLGESGNERRTKRFENTKSYLTTAFSTKAKTYIHPGLTLVGNPKSGPTKKEWIKHKDWKTFTITLPGDSEPGSFVGNLDASHCKVVVELQWEQTYTINGCASSPQVLKYVPGDDRYGITYCHELGHSMGMTIMHDGSKPAPGLTEPDHVDAGGDYYRDPWFNGEAAGSDGIRNHKGSHCGYQVADKTLAAFNAGDGTCALYGSGPGIRTGYCPTCIEHLSARKLTDVRAGWDSRSADDY